MNDTSKELLQHKLSMRQIGLFSLLIVLAAQVNLDVFTNNFLVSIGHKLSMRQIGLFSLLIVLAAQVNLDVFTNNFLVSIGILMFPIFVYLFGFLYPSVS